MTISLNEKKLVDSGYLDWFLAFCERYNDVFFTYGKSVNAGNSNNSSCSFLSIAKGWVEDKKYDSIRYFLKDTSPFSSTCPFTSYEFIAMDPSAFDHWKDYVTLTCALHDERDALYDELLSFYEVFPEEK